jgi:DNA-directed RNA polymerase subunit H (RpoH/RPB5)
VIESVEIIKHELVPKHEILSDDGKNDVLSMFKVTDKQLPKILISDPVVEMIGAKPGNVLRITRKSPTAGEAVYYRIVVEK